MPWFRVGGQMVHLKMGGVLGHKSGLTTQRYSHLVTGTLDAAVRLIGKRKTPVAPNPPAKKKRKRA